MYRHVPKALRYTRTDPVFTTRGKIRLKEKWSNFFEMIFFLSREIMSPVLEVCSSRINQTQTPLPLSTMKQLSIAFLFPVSIQLVPRHPRLLSCFRRGEHLRSPHVVLSKAGSVDQDEAYVFQPSPFRGVRHRLFAQSSSTSKNETESEEGTGRKNSEVSSGKGSRKSGKSNASAAVKKKTKSDFLPNPTFDSLFQDHDELVNALLAIQDDPLQTHGGKIVTFRGTPRARLMIVGEAPGEQEDRLGIPFVGRAGQLLDKIFKYGGFNIDTQVYLTNVVKRRPPNNRDPTVEEISYFLPYLHEEIRLVDPVIIILAGNIATKAFLGQDVRITQVRGTWFGGQLGNPWIMPIFHPSYLLRFEAQKFKMVTDIEAIRAKYMQLVPDDPLAALSKQ